VVNKDVFCEPMGLRRILQDVRDAEWEAIRRKLQESRSRVAGLEREIKALREKEALPISLGVGDSDAQKVMANLREEVAALTAREAEAARTFAASKQQQEVAFDRLREAMETLRAELVPLRAENAEIHGQLAAARKQIEAEQRALASAKAEVATIKARGAGRRTGPLSSPSIGG
jgi:chromosome segregation ATPase